MEKFCKVFSSFRKAQGLSQMQFAKKMGVSQAFLSGVENDERLLSHTRLSQLSEVFDLSADEKNKLFSTWYNDCGVIEINTCGYEPHQKELLSCLFDHLENLDKDQVKKILKVCTED